MKSSMDHVIHTAIHKEGGELNLIYMPYDGMFEWMMSTLPYKLYAPQNTSVYQWQCNNWPSNINWMPQGVKALPNRGDISGVVVNWRKDHAFTGEQMADQFHIPLIMVEHELPDASANQNLRNFVNSKMPNKAVFVTTHRVVRDEWDLDDSMEAFNIPYGFVVQDNKDILKDKEVLVVGDYSRGDSQMLEEMLSCVPDVTGIGYNQGTKEYSTLNEIILQMRRYKICITASQPNRPPLLAMMAAACGCAVVTNETRWTKAIFTEGKTALFFDAVSEIKKLVRTLTQSSELVDDMSIRSRKMIFKDHSMSAFIKNWTNLIQTLSKRVYIR